MKATTDGTLADTPVEFEDKNAACVIMASEGDPGSYEKGYEITIPAAIADTLEEAIDSSYRMVEQIHFDNAYYRRDIGKRALEVEN